MSDSLKQYMEDHRRAVQLKQLDILKEIDALCQRHHIDYWLDGGTILGAVRHGGFIPWDDDIDIAMRLDDLPRFVEEAKQYLRCAIKIPSWSKMLMTSHVLMVRDYTLTSFR